MTIEDLRVSLLRCVAPVILLAGQALGQNISTGASKTDIAFDPVSHVVTSTLWIQDPQGYFIPNIRPDNFAVYENGSRQDRVSVEVEHARVSLGVLAEYGGRYQSLNEAVATAVGMVTRQLLDERGEHDAIALWSYGDAVVELTGFTDDRDTLRKAVTGLSRPPFSELNFYDSLIAALGRMPHRSGRQALIIVGSGIDTFSKSHFNDVLAAIRANAIAVYVIDIGKAVRQLQVTSTGPGNYPERRWQQARVELAQIAAVSGGRLYVPQVSYDTASIFDDILENLRVRYVIRYTSASDWDLSRARSVRIQLVDPGAGRALNSIDQHGKHSVSSMAFEQSYVPVVPRAEGRTERSPVKVN